MPDHRLSRAACARALLDQLRSEPEATHEDLVVGVILASQLAAFQEVDLAAKTKGHVTADDAAQVIAVIKVMIDQLVAKVPT